MAELAVPGFEGPATRRTLHANVEVMMGGEAKLLAQGWRRCALGQRTTQWCAHAEEQLLPLDRYPLPATGHVPPA